MVLGIPCPLTILEETLRQNPVYEGSFIASWMNRIIYLEGVDPQHVVVMDIGFAILVIFSFLWKPLKPAKWKRGGGSKCFDISQSNISGWRVEVEPARLWPFGCIAQHISLQRKDDCQSLSCLEMPNQSERKKVLRQLTGFFLFPKIHMRWGNRGL